MRDLQESEVQGNAKLGRTEHRPYWVLSLSITLRALHQVGAAVFLAAFLLDLTLFPKAYLYLAVISGIALVAAEGMRHRQMYREFSGGVTLLKCMLLGLAVHGFMPATPLVIIAFLLASMGAHAPKQIRHRLLF